ncbi:MAG: 2-amino-4-hydroxy-6-hydroxymethyldihydropteridine diphosphokinase [Alphaproteobacteria bacterium]|nr:2-amino-4-hydroxy-6-hydroxymethyldihydropteridine diphosphokinase [Alphaproteobacteria bacterium]
MILIGLGANLPSPEHGPPQATLAAALDALEARGARVLRRSPWYESAPVPPSGQPWYVNAVAEVESRLSPPALLDALLAVEAGFGRTRGVRNASRSVDLDLLDHGGLVTGPDEKPELPHPRLHERAFVLLPLRDIAPGWRHPASGRTVEALIEALGRPGPIRRLP